MRKYEAPELTLHKLAAVDIACTSVGLTDDGVIDESSPDTPFIPQG